MQEEYRTIIKLAKEKLELIEKGRVCAEETKEWKVYWKFISCEYKECLCSVLKQMAATVHPDTVGGDGEVMKTLTSLLGVIQKGERCDDEQVDIIDVIEESLIRTLIRIGWVGLISSRCYDLEIEQSGIVRLRKCHFIKAVNDTYRIPDFISIIEEEAFMEVSVSWKSLIIPACVRQIGERAFYKRCVSEVVFEHGIQDELTICEAAFGGTMIREVELPVCAVIKQNRHLWTNNRNALFGSVTEKGWKGACDVAFIFTQEHLDKLVEQGRTASDILNKVAVRTFVRLLDVKSIPDRMFEECIGLEAVSVQGDLQVVGDYAFAHCTGLVRIGCLTEEEASRQFLWHADWAREKYKSCELPTVTKIGVFAFSGCNGLTEVRLEKCARVESFAFGGTRKNDSCSELKKVELPNCKELGDSVFANDGALQKVDIRNCRRIGNTVFMNCTQLEPPRFGDRIYAVGRGLFRGHGQGLMYLPVVNEHVRKMLSQGIEEDDDLTIEIDMDAWD